MSIYSCFTFRRLTYEDLFLQVNPHTHQVKLCDFGSAKVLVTHYSISFSVFCPSNEELGNHKFLIYYFVLYLFLTGQRRAKYLVHLFSILSCSRTHIWSYWIYISNWHMVCGLCSCWIAAWTGFRNSYFLLFTSKQTDVMEMDEFLLAFDFFLLEYQIR